VAKVELAPEIGDDFERILARLAEYKVDGAASRIGEIVQAIAVLEQNPLIGRRGPEDKRELVIGRLSHGYLALYRYVAEIDTVFVLAVRSQREAGYTRP